MWTLSLIDDVFDLRNNLHPSSVSSSDARRKKRSYENNQKKTNQGTNLSQPQFDEDSDYNYHYDLVGTKIVHASCPLDLFLKAYFDVVPFQIGDDEMNSIRQEFSTNRVAQIALADFIARQIAMAADHVDDKDSIEETPNKKKKNAFIQTFHNDSATSPAACSVLLEPLDRTTMQSNYHNIQMLHSDLLFRSDNEENVINNDTKSPQSEYQNYRHRHRSLRTNNRKHYLTPFILERTDVCCCRNQMHIYLRAFCYHKSKKRTCTSRYGSENHSMDDDDNTAENLGLEMNYMIEQATKMSLDHFFLATSNNSNNHVNNLSSGLDPERLLNHVAMTVLQEQLRLQLQTASKHHSAAVAFIADHSILPRKSGANAAPMSSKQAIPFAAPHNCSSVMTCTSFSVDVGVWKHYLDFRNTNYEPFQNRQQEGEQQSNRMKISSTVVTLSGLLVPRGVTLIVGGGYHGKSTLLRCIAAGVYNKIPGDGRELCVTCDKAVTIRAEDGRYVNNCNISGFISNLPALKSPANDGSANSSVPFDTKHFSTGEASGSTSQASNVVEAIEMGCSAFLVDEDVSAANFMARDGRMRSLVMDESITPLLYRVNGIYASLGISSVVVVGGVGDWLDVPNNVILLDKYVCKDATAKAQSISQQFSHGHVQYAGRGVVHRLQWDKFATPLPRKPVTATKDVKNNKLLFNGKHLKVKSTAVTLLDGTNSISLQHTFAYDEDSSSGSEDDLSTICMNENNEEEVHVSDIVIDDGDDRYIDMSRCEQLLGTKPQLYGCGLCVVRILEMSRLKHPDSGLSELLDKLDSELDEHGYLSLLLDLQNPNKKYSEAWKVLVESLGYSYRPRRFEVGQALTRLRGIQFEEIAQDDKEDPERIAKEMAERQKQDLLAIWNARRKKNPIKYELEQEIMAQKS